MTIDNSSLELKLASIKFNLKTADAAFEEKHPRDGGKFTSKGGGDSGNDDKDKPKSNPKMSNLGKIESIYGEMLGIADPDLQGDPQGEMPDFSDEDKQKMADKHGITFDQAEEIWDSAGTTDIDLGDSEEKKLEKYRQEDGPSEHNDSIKKGDILAFSDPYADGGDERHMRFRVLEDNGNRVLVQDIKAKGTFAPTSTMAKSHFINANEDSEELAKATDDPVSDRESHQRHVEKHPESGNPSDSTLQLKWDLKSDDDKRQFINYELDAHDDDHGGPDEHDIRGIRDYFVNKNFHGDTPEKEKERLEEFTDKLNYSSPDIFNLDDFDEHKEKSDKEMGFVKEHKKRLTGNLKNATKLANKLSKGSDYERDAGKKMIQDVEQDLRIIEYREIKAQKIADTIKQVQKKFHKKPRSKKTASMTLMQGTFQTGSISDQFKSSDGGSYVSYFLLNDTENLKGWGVTPESIPRHIASFKGMPFVITSKKFHDASPYGDVTDHPSTEHFGGLGIKLGSGVGPQWRSRETNDIMQQAKFQEEFRVGNIEDVFKKANGDWHALIRLDAKFEGHQMPPLVSPALFQLNPQEASNHITTWVGMHLAGLDEKPAYGNSAVYTGSCYGTAGECLTKLSASMNDQPMMPCFKGKFAALNLKLANIRLDLIRQAGGPGSGPQTGEGEIEGDEIFNKLHRENQAKQFREKVNMSGQERKKLLRNHRLGAMSSGDHSNIEQENHLCSNENGGMESCATDKITHEI